MTKDGKTLEDMKVIDQLLDDRVYLIKTIDNLDLLTFNCISLSITDRISCKQKILDYAATFNQKMANMAYDEMIKELSDIESRLEDHDIQLEPRKYLSAEKKITAEGLIREVPVKENSPIKHETLSAGDDVGITYDEKYV